MVKSEALNLIPQTSLSDALAGKVAGVQFRSQSPSKLNATAAARIRGGLMLSGDVSPIYVVDGTIISNDVNKDGTTQPNDGAYDKVFPFSVMAIANSHWGLKKASPFMSW